MAKRGPAVGVVGAGSLVGREILNLLEGVPAVAEIRALSDRMAGTALEWRGGDLTVEDLDDEGLAELAVAIFCPGEKRSRRWAQVAADKGAAVIDLSAARRLDPATGLAGAREAALPARGRVVSLPGAASLLAARLLEPLERPAGVQALEATLLLPASGAGAAGVRELSRQSAKLLSSGQSPARRFPHRLAFNVIPEVMGFEGQEDRAELAFRRELRRLLGAPELTVTVTAVRVPVFFGLCAALTVQLARPLDAGAARELWQGRAGVELIDEPSQHLYPMASLASGYDGVLVGRLRSAGPRLSCFAATDPLKLIGRAAVQATLAALR
ncbi:MAG TPA: Asd/ArgC dimerization domain-containing protein [Myxococcales bacterium]|nr:Asd/ArgC dimerization domain-containing protein [Myxococcales bacterium]